MKPTILKMLLSGSLVSALALTAGCSRSADQEEAEESSPKVTETQETTGTVERETRTTGSDME